MATLFTIPIKTDINACLSYISDKEKSISQKDTMRLMTYMQSHAAERKEGIGFNGCPGDKQAALTHFRTCEKMYEMQSPKWKTKPVTVAVTPEKYLEMAGRIKELPKNVVPDEDGLIRIEKTDVLAYHLIFSLMDDEKVEPDVLYKIWQEMMELPELQDFYAYGNAHLNTDNHHLHIVIPNASKKGNRRFSMNNTLRDHLRNELDHICVKYGLSIIDNSKLAYKYPEREAWIEQLVQDKTVKVYLPSNVKELENPTAHQRRMLALHAAGLVELCKDEAYEGKFKNPSRQKKQMAIHAAREERINRLPDTTISAAERKAALKCAEKKNLFFGAPYMTRKNLSPSQRKEFAKAKEYGQIYYAIPLYKGRRRKNRMELEIEYGYAVFKDYPRHQTDWTLQSKLKMLTLCRELNVRSPDDLNLRLKDIGEEIGRTDRYIAYQKRTIEKGQPLFDAIQIWRDPTQEESAKKAAYRVMAAHKCTEPSQLDDFLKRREAALDRLPALEGKQVSLEDLNKKREELSKQYKTIKRTLESIRLEQAEQEILSHRFAENLKTRWETDTTPLAPKKEPSVPDAKEVGLDAVIKGLDNQRQPGKKEIVKHERDA